MKPFYIVVPNPGSGFAKGLQSALSSKIKCRVLRTGRSSALRAAREFHVTGQPLNKIQQLTRFKENNVPCPNFTTESGAVESLGSRIVFARKTVTGTNGEGIEEFRPGVDSTPNAPLFTAYIPKKSEYRFHVFFGEVIDQQEKRIRSGTEGVNTHVRNLENGYVYCRDNCNPPDAAADIAVRAVQAVGYNYGAVDLIYNEKQNQAYVLEVNSRPGLTGTTLDNYADAIINRFNLK